MLTIGFLDLIRRSGLIHTQYLVVALDTSFLLLRLLVLPFYTAAIISHGFARCRSLAAMLETQQSKGQRLLVTVGTTKFDALIKEIFSDQLRKLFIDAGFCEWRVQHGSSPAPAEIPNGVEAFPYRSDLTDDIEWADLVIGHSGVPLIRMKNIHATV